MMRNILMSTGLTEAGYRGRSSLLPLLIAMTLFLFCGKNDSRIDDNNSASSLIPPSVATRIVSLAPNATEILYALGLGDKVCGVTRFCNYPPEVAQKEKIGVQADHSYEAVARLKPDLAVILKEQRGMTAFFDRYAIRYVTIGSDSVDEILESIQAVADACSISDRGKDIVNDLRERMGLGTADIKEITGQAGNDDMANGVSTDTHKAVNNDKPKILLCVSRDGIGTGTVGKCFVAGVAAFYDQLIDASGGINAMKGVKQAYPAITAEAVIRMAPDVIIDISMSYSDNRRQLQENCDDWRSLDNVPAVKDNRVYCMAGDYLTIPGPRVWMIIEDFKNVVRQR
jgi:iron complex transport system substrate-binding protein